MRRTTIFVALAPLVAVLPIVAASGQPELLVRVDPALRHQRFTGWGTSLAWWATKVGGWSEANRRKIIDLVFDRERGLGLTIVRYCIGGGENPACPWKPHMREDAIAEGFLDADGSWHWERDAAQRRILAEAKARGATHFEANANTPPWWMTESGCAAGHRDPAQDNLKPEYCERFAAYLATVVKRFRDAWGVRFAWLSPVNEPSARFWRGGNRQEGCHWSRAGQARAIAATRRALDAAGLADVALAAAEESDLDDMVRTWRAYDTATRGLVAKINTHTYAGSRRAELRDLALSAGKPLWMSEVCVAGGTPHDHGSIRAGLDLADRILGDMRELKPEAWVIWQAVDNERHIGAENWGPIHAWYSGPDKERFFVTKQYQAYLHFTRHVRPGDTIVDSDDPGSLAAVSPGGDRVSVVVRNRSSEARACRVDLSRFDHAGPPALAAYRTTATDDHAPARGARLSGGFVHDTLPPLSLTTYVVTRVRHAGARGAVVNDNVTGNGINQVEYSPGWSYIAGQTGPWSGDNHWAGTAGVSFRIRFRGTGITLCGARDPVHGIAAVSIDGGRETEIDLYAARREEQVPWFASPRLAAGEHVVAVRVTGRKHPASRWTHVPLDKFIVRE